MYHYCASEYMCIGILYHLKIYVYLTLIICIIYCYHLYLYNWLLIFVVILLIIITCLCLKREENEGEMTEKECRERGGGKGQWKRGEKNSYKILIIAPNNNSFKLVIYWIWITCLPNYVHWKKVPVTFWLFKTRISFYESKLIMGWMLAQLKSYHGVAHTFGLEVASRLRVSGHIVTWA